MRNRTLSRRAFLRSTVFGGAGLAAAYTLGCGDSNGGDATAPSATAPLSSPAAATPRASTSLTWTQASVSGALPPPRRDHSLSSDGAVLYLFGGRGDGAFADLWTFDPATGAWTEIAAAGPTSRFGHNAAWHPQSNRLIVFGGQGGDGPFANDLWAFDPAAGAWAQLDDGTGPSPRYGAGSTLTLDGQLIVTHGFTDQGRFDDTWQYDIASGTWTDISPPALRPVERCLIKAVWTEVMDQHLLTFGGQTTDSPFLGDMWSLAEGRSWSEVVRNPSPPARNQYSLIYNRALDKIVMFGGDSEDGPLADLWWFDARDEFWDAPALDGEPPSARFGHDAAWLDATTSMYVFGGSDGAAELNDLWQLAPAGA